MIILLGLLVLLGDLGREVEVDSSSLPSIRSLISIWAINLFYQKMQIQEKSFERKQAKRKIFYLRISMKNKLFCHASQHVTEQEETEVGFYGEEEDTKKDQQMWR